jgi:CRISPR type I-E-associated protein CasB/Cse2
LSNSLQEQTKIFIGYLQKLADEERTEALIALRHGIRSKKESVEMAPYIDPWVKKSAPWTRRCYYLTGSLFALHPSVVDVGNMGDHLLAIQGISLPARKTRLSRLLSLDNHLVGDEIVRIVQWLQTEEIPVNYARLLYDLITWGHASRFVQRSWAAAFYQTAGSQRERPTLFPGG